MSDFIWIGVGIVGALIYATIGVATYHISYNREQGMGYGDGDNVRTAETVTVVLLYIAIWLYAGFTTSMAGGPHVEGGILMGATLPLLGLETAIWVPEVGSVASSIPRSIFWPVHWLGYIVAFVASIAAKGPLVWGAYIGEFPQRRENKQKALVQQVKDRDAHIAELEREVLSGV